jgi:heme-degrading monooxygenase HmoA
MIVRVWHGRTRREGADAYQTHVVSSVFSKLAAIDGYVGGRVLRRETDKDVEFLVMTEWTSWNAIKAFAGQRPEVAVIEPEARAMLIDADEHVRHFAVVHESRRA